MVNVTLRSLYPLPPRERTLITIEKEAWVGYRGGPDVSEKRKIARACIFIFFVSVALFPVSVALFPVRHYAKIKSLVIIKRKAG